MVSEAFSSHLEVFESFINRFKSDSEAKAVSLLGRFCLAFQNAFFLYVAGVNRRHRKLAGATLESYPEQPLIRSKVLTHIGLTVLWNDTMWTPVRIEKPF